MSPREARFTIVNDGPDILVIKDVGPWNKHPTVTNDADNVVAKLAPTLNGRRLRYIDSLGTENELVVRNGRFSHFAP